jgi:hypothetical protein
MIRICKKKKLGEIHMSDLKARAKILTENV